MHIVDIYSSDYLRNDVQSRHEVNLGSELKSAEVGEGVAVYAKYGISWTQHPGACA